MRSNKKAAIQLSMNMLVVIILAIVIFGFGIALLYNIMGKAFQLKGTTDEKLDEQLEMILCDKPVCMTTNYKKIYRREYEIFGLRVYNNRGSAEYFQITVSPAEPKGYDKEGNELTADDPDLYYVAGVEGSQRTIELGPSREKGIGIGIEVPKDVKSGIYVFNVNVIVVGENIIYGSPQQIRVEVP